MTDTEAFLTLKGDFRFCSAITCTREGLVRRFGGVI